MLAEKVISPDEITLNRETKIAFDNPFYAEANTSYAVVLLTNSTDYRAHIATLGQRGQNGVITRQTYAQDVLLESSNTETWTPLNASDLTLKIYGYDFEASGEVRFEPVTGVEFSELNLDEYSAIPEDTGIAWEYSTDDGSTWDGTTGLGGEPAEPRRQRPGTGPARRQRSQRLTRAQLQGCEPHRLPQRHVWRYVTRENELTQGVASTKVYTQMHIPSGTSVDWYASNDGDTWESLTLDATREIDKEWTEYTLTRTFDDPAGDKVRYKAELARNRLVYPRIHTLGATLS